MTKKKRKPEVRTKFAFRSWGSRGFEIPDGVLIGHKEEEKLYPTLIAEGIARKNGMQVWQIRKGGKVSLSGGRTGRKYTAYEIVLGRPIVEPETEKTGGMTTYYAIGFVFDPDQGTDAWKRARQEHIQFVLAQAGIDDYPE